MLNTQSPETAQVPIRHNWTSKEVMALFEMPFNDLIFTAHSIHRQHFNPNQVQVSTLLSIKTGGCQEDCKYCSQSSHYKTTVKAEKIMDAADVAAAARKAKESGASRFCMGAAWRELKDRDMPKITEMIKNVKDLGLESCMTLGMLTSEQAKSLKEAGLDYYNHNLDTSPEYYGEVITTRTYQDRLDTLEHVREAGMKTCCGGIVGMGEERTDRASLLLNLANMPEHPHSVPINMLVAIKGTPLGASSGDEHGNINNIEFVRTIAVARIMMPASHVRLSAGREQMSDEMQALCFFAGANSIFYGEKLLTTPNADASRDRQLFEKLGLEAA